MQWLQHLFRRRKIFIPDALWHDCIARIPITAKLLPEEQTTLKALSEKLLASKTITGAGGFEITDEIAVAIAAQACLPVLNLTLALYDDISGIIVYPAAFIVPHTEMDEAGIVHEWVEPLSGEAIYAGGAVVLSWEDMDGTSPFSDANNLIVHEFAHKIDMGRGSANGCPPFLMRYHASLEARQWQQVFSEAFTDLTRRVENMERQLPDNFDPDYPLHAAHYDMLCAALPMDSYASQHPAEFFAVASESFLMRPQRLVAAYPDLYRLLAQYYRQNPLLRI
jgi:Mlc titration factor MtfA (ptsG expression regulator)